MSHPNFSHHLAVRPPLPPGIHFRANTEWLPFPLNQEGCRIYSLARHAIWNACHALGLESNHIILVPAYHHGSEIEALLKAGIKIRYYELNENLEPDVVMLESLLGPDVRVLYLIHYLGFPQNAVKWRKWCDENNLLLIEDAAQAFLATLDGQPLGSFGHMGVFCLYKTYGIPDGAAIITLTSIPKPASPATSGTWRTFKCHFHWMSERNGTLGFIHLQVEPFVSWLKKQIDSPNVDFELGDPSTPPANMSNRLLTKILDKQTAQRRRENYRYLLEHLGEMVPPPFATLPDGACPHAFPIEVEDATLFLKQLRKYGVVGLLFWLYQHPSLPAHLFPRSMALRNRLVALPVHQELTFLELQQIVEAVKKTCTHKSISFKQNRA